MPTPILALAVAKKLGVAMLSIKPKAIYLNPIS